MTIINMGTKNLTDLAGWRAGWVGRGWNTKAFGVPAGTAALTGAGVG